jgi:hypothetical protein
MQDVRKSRSSTMSPDAYGDGICTDALPLGLTATLGINPYCHGDIRDADKRACCSQRAKSSLRVAGSVLGFSHSICAHPAISASNAAVVEYRIMDAL